MSGFLPTAQFASLVYGAAGVSRDDPAELYHEASRLYPRIAAERLDVLQELEASDELARTFARSARTHDHRPAVALPEPVPLTASLESVLARRRSSRPEALRPLALSELAAILRAAYSTAPRPGAPDRRPVPSAGALYPLELYVLAVAVRELEPALYHFHPFKGVLSRLRSLDAPRIHEALVDRALADDVAAVLVVTAVFWRSRCKYGLRGYRFALLEAGHLVQNVGLAAAALALPALPLGGFYDRRHDELVGADGLDEASVSAVALGGSA